MLLEYNLKTSRTLSGPVELGALQEAMELVEQLRRAVVALVKAIAYYGAGGLTGSQPPIYWVATYKQKRRRP